MREEEGKPECFGDPEVHDPETSDCQSCAVIGACAIRTRRRIAANSGRRNVPVHRRTSRRTSKRKETIVVVESDNEDTYGTVLMHNAGLEAVQAMVDELSNSIKSIK